MKKLGLMGIFLVLLLTGCLYPNEKRIESAPPYPEQLQAVQESINQYREETGVLPIHDFDQHTPLYHRYAIDFNKLIPRFLREPPSNAFESGGPYRYVLINVEEQPEVKLIDLRLSQEVTALQMHINYYLHSRPYLPIENMLEGGYFTLDYKELGLKASPQVKSPYSDNHLPLIVDQRGQVGIDYRLDLYQALQQTKVENIEEGDDLRKLLTVDSPFVPAHSFPYTIENGEPRLVESWKRDK